MSNTLEKTSLRIGMMPLADAAPFVVAQARGFFARHGLEVEIARERAWAAVRDKLATDVLDAAQLLAPMPLASTLGLDAVQVPMLTALTLNLNGNAIVVSAALRARLSAVKSKGDDSALAWAHALKRVIADDQAADRPPLVFAHVYPFSTHHYELRYWLAAGEIHPDHDLNLIVVPPPQMVTQLNAGRIDGYCVGAPWGEMAEHLGIGARIVSKYQIWNNSPEKVLGVTRTWAEQHPNTHTAMVAALLEAGRWLDHPPHRDEAAQLMCDGHYLDAPLVCVRSALQTAPEHSHFGPGIVFHAGAAGFPWLSHAQWFLRQMQRWQALPADTDLEHIAAEVYRPDLHRIAASRTDTATPNVESKSEGGHNAPWSLRGWPDTITMGPDLFLDGAVLP